MPHPHLDGVAGGLCLLEQLEQDAGRPVEVVGMDELEHLHVREVAGWVAKEPLGARRRVEHLAVGTEHGDDVARVQQQGAPALLADAQRFLGALAFGDVAPGEHQALDVGVVQQVGHRELEPAP